MEALAGLEIGFSRSFLPLLIFGFSLKSLPLVDSGVDGGSYWTDWEAVPGTIRNRASPKSNYGDPSVNAQP